MRCAGNRLLLGFWVLLLGGARADATLGAWTWMNPSPHGANVVDLARLGSRYLQVGESGQIFTSTNRLGWELVPSGTRLELRGVTTLGPRWLVVGESGLALWSDDLLAFQPGTLAPSTPGWLEAVAASARRAVAVGDEGAIYWSDDGLRWVVAESVPSRQWLRGVAYGADIFVAVGESGTILTSPDGTRWTARESGVTTDLNRITHGAGRFVAVGDGGEVLVSTNGMAWVRQRLPTGVTPNLLTATSTEHGIVVAGEAALYFRPDRSPGWQNHLLDTTSPSPAPEWTYAASVWNGEELVLSGQTGVTVVGIPVDTLPIVVWAWFRSDESSRSGVWDVERFGRLYLGAGEVSTVLSSVAGAPMEIESAPGAAETVLYGMGGSTNLALVVGSGGAVWRSRNEERAGVVTNRVEVGGDVVDWVTTNRASLLGVQWETVATGVTSKTLQGVGWNGRQYVIVGAEGTVLRSAEGESWEAGRLPSRAFHSSVAASPELWVAAGDGGALASSPDAVTWTPLDSGVTNWIYRVRWDGERWMAVGQRGLILESADGRSWTRRDAGTTAWLTDVRRVGTQYFVCGAQGLLMRSPDRVAWEQVETPTGKPFYAMATRGEELVLAGAEGVVVRLLLDAPGAPVEIAQYQHRDVAGRGIDLLRFEGLAGRAFRLESGGELGNWQPAHSGRLGSTGEALVGREAPAAVQFHRSAAVP